MPAILHRLDDTVVEILPTYPDTMYMSGKYVIDFPDHFDLKLSSPTPTIAEINSKVNELFQEKFISFEQFVTNNLSNTSDFLSKFAIDPTLNISVVSNQFLPISPANPEYNFSNSFKNGAIPNTTSVIGRFPQKNLLEGATVTSDQSLPGNRCIITQDIDIIGSTANNLGRSDFFIYFRSALKSYTKDKSLSDTEKQASSPLTSNQKGSMAYTNTQYDSPNRLRCFISGDGSGYQEIENLKVFSFNGRVDTIKLAWVNYTDADLTLLSYTLMY
jgi:hypothetical protein